MNTKNKTNKKSFFDYFTEILGWLQIVASPFLIGLIVGFLIYVSEPNSTRLFTGIAVAVVGLIIGIIWATRVWTKQGTINFVSRISATPELDRSFKSVQDKFVKAKLKLIATENGGRFTPIFTNYRPNHVFEYVDGMFIQTYIGEIQFSKEESIEPGEEKIVIVRFLYVPVLEKYLQVGRIWWIHEGGRKVGEAEIIELL
jgi:hypothetical protein